MSELSSTFGTAILTSKSPEEAAEILPNCLSSSNSLIERNLLTWFSKYGAYLQKQNAELQELLNYGGGFFQGGEQRPVFGSFPNVWNSVLNSIQVRIHSNELLYKNIKLDVIGPMRDAIEKDVRYSELLVNSNELKEISTALGRNAENAEYQWNIKAPQIFDNFENFKKYEMQLLFDVVLNFYNANNQSTGKSLSNDESTVNHLLGRFKIEKEMDSYLNFLLNTNFKPTKSAPTNQEAKHFATSKKRFSSIPKLDNSSIISSASTTNTKKTSKLKSRVGSIFGRKNKAEKFTGHGSESIAEINSTSSRRFKSNDNLARSHTRSSSVISNTDSVRRKAGDAVPRYNQPPNTGSLGNSSQYGPPVPNPKVRSQNEVDGSTFPQGPKSQGYDYSNLQTQSRGPHIDDVNQEIPKSRIPSDKSNLNQIPQETIQEERSYPSPEVQVTPANENRGFNPNDTYNSPNLVKYSSDSSDEEDDIGNQRNTGGRRKSLLEQHNLAPNLAQNRSGVSTELPRPASTGIYSFESGDDKQPISAISRSESKQKIESQLPVNSDNGSSASRLEKSSLANSSTLIETPSNSGPQRSPFDSVKSRPEGQERSAVSSYSNPPPPPPSRKVAHKESESSNPSVSLPGAFITGSSKPKNREDVQSQLFHNLPSTRDSVIQPRPALVSQDTGSSQMRQTDFFKHFDSSNNVELKGLNSSIAEVINVSFKDGELSSSQIIGEIAFNYNPTKDEGPVQPHLLKIANSFDKIILNNTFMEQINKDTFKLNPYPVVSKTLGGLKYLKRLESSQVPILIHQIWKFEDHQSSLMTSLKLNPNYATAIQLNNLVVSVALSPDVEVSSASSRPQGSFNKEKSRITWRYNSPLDLNSFKSEEKLIARFMTNGKGSEHESGIQVKFQIVDPPLKLSSISSMNDETSVSCTRNLITGSYSSHS